LPQNTILIAATNQVDTIDKALLRRFEFRISLDLPSEIQIKQIIDITIKKTPFKIRSKKELSRIIKLCNGLSYFLIQKTLITAIKRSLFEFGDKVKQSFFIDTKIWEDLILKEK
jgi:AAA+ superfamily predicted ATPase